MFLTDLTFIEDGTPNELPGGLVNFAKRRSLAQVIREIQQFQQCPFNFEAVPAIQKILDNAKPLSTDDAYKLSLGTHPHTIMMSQLCFSLIVSLSLFFCTMGAAYRDCAARVAATLAEADQGDALPLQEAHARGPDQRSA
jgi:hypothetical protein